MSKKLSTSQPACPLSKEELLAKISTEEEKGTEVQPRGRRCAIYKTIEKGLDLEVVEEGKLGTGVRTKTEYTSLIIYD